MPVSVPPVPTPATTASTAPPVSPDLLRRRRPVRRWIGGVVELAEHEGVWDLPCQSCGAVDRALHALRARRQHDAGAEGAQGDAPFLAHGVRHHQHARVAFDRGDEGEGDAGVAARRLDQHGVAGCDVTASFRRLDHRQADPVLYARGGVPALQLGDDLGGDIARHTVQSDQGGVADQVCDVRGDVHVGSARATQKMNCTRLISTSSSGRSPPFLAPPVNVLWS